MISLRSVTRAIAASTVLLCVTACGPQTKDPKRVYEEFHSALLRSGRGDPAALSIAMSHLSQDTLSALAKRAEAVNQRLPEGAPKVDPRQMLSVASLSRDVAPTDIEIEALSQDALNLTVTLDSEKIPVPMIREGKHWKIRLALDESASSEPASPPSNP